jgi:ssDNA-binding replication factor A large subunit
VSASVDEMFQKLLDLGLSEEELEKKLKNKVEEYGGFMSKQGLLFIIARENGLDLRSPDIDDYLYDALEEEIDYDDFTIDISDVKEEMRNIVVLGKILSVEKVREFVRKDESIGKVCSFWLGDPTGTVKVVLWDERVNSINQKYFKPNALVRVIGGYSKLGQNQAIEIHLGRKGMLNLSPEVSKRTREQLGAIVVTRSEKRAPNSNLEPLEQTIHQKKYINIVKGTVQIEEFKELRLKSGDKSFLLTVLLDVDGFTVRVKAWGMKAVECLKIVNNGDFISITNLAVNESKYTGEKELLFTKNSSVLLI